MSFPNLQAELASNAFAQLFSDSHQQHSDGPGILRGLCSNRLRRLSLKIEGFDDGTRLITEALQAVLKCGEFRLRGLLQKRIDIGRRRSDFKQFLRNDDTCQTPAP